MGGYAGIAECGEDVQEGDGVGAATEPDDDGLSGVQEVVALDVGLDGVEHRVGNFWGIQRGQRREVIGSSIFRRACETLLIMNG